MFQVNDVIVYGNHGVCRVTKIGTLALSMVDKEKLYYSLCPVYQKETIIYAPVDYNGKVMRPVLSRQEAEELIDQIPQLDCVWVVNEKERETQYRETLKTCDCRELVKMIKTLYLRRQERLRAGKKMTALDERYFSMAEERLYGELAFALDMEREKVCRFITDSIEGKGIMVTDR